MKDNILSFFANNYIDEKFGISLVRIGDVEQRPWYKLLTALDKSVERFLEICPITYFITRNAPIMLLRS